MICVKDKAGEVECPIELANYSEAGNTLVTVIELLATGVCVGMTGSNDCDGCDDTRLAEAWKLVKLIRDNGFEIVRVKGGK